MTADTRYCEFEHDRPEPATVFGGFAGADSWSGFACEQHAHTPGFRIWHRLDIRTAFAASPHAALAERIRQA